VPSSSGTLTATRQVTLRPVTAAGRPAPGWTVKAGGPTIDCSAGERSAAATTDGVLTCDPSAASASACWRAADGAHAYCLYDPRTRTLSEDTLQGGAFPAARPSEIPPAPLGVDLVGDVRCTQRDGGAASALAQHPDWVVYYYCGADAGDAVWAAPDAADGGVSRDDGPWSVQLASSDGSAKVREVLVGTAYFVATGG
jgi:hypothetical protein